VELRGTARSQAHMQLWWRRAIEPHELCCRRDLWRLLERFWLSPSITIRSPDTLIDSRASTIFSRAKTGPSTTARLSACFALSHHAESSRRLIVAVASAHSFSTPFASHPLASVPATGQETTQPVAQSRSALRRLISDSSRSRSHALSIITLRRPRTPTSRDQWSKLVAGDRIARAVQFAR
jgi:hypothetical protein